MISPVIFEGGTLQTCQVSYNQVSRPKPDGKVARLHELSVVGYILPTAFHQLCMLLPKLQRSNFRVLVDIEQTSVVYNARHGSQPDRARLEQEQHQADSAVGGHGHCMHRAPVLGQNAIREIRGNAMGKMTYTASPIKRL
jgi:hypothetical protein